MSFNRWSILTTVALSITATNCVATPSDADLEIKTEWSEYRGGAGYNVKQDGDSLVEINEKIKLKHPEEEYGTHSCRVEVRWHPFSSPESMMMNLSHQ